MTLRALAEGLRARGDAPPPRNKRNASAIAVRGQPALNASHAYHTPAMRHARYVQKVLHVAARDLVDASKQSDTSGRHERRRDTWRGAKRQPTPPGWQRAGRALSAIAIARWSLAAARISWRSTTPWHVIALQNARAGRPACSGRCGAGCEVTRMAAAATATPAQDLVRSALQLVHQCLRGETDT